MSTIFSAYDIRGHVDESLTTEQSWNIGKAFAEWVPDEGALAVVKAANANDSTYHALVEGLLLQGRDVIDCGTGDQLAVLGCINEKRAVGGVFVSHDDADNLEVITLFDGGSMNITDKNGLNEISQLVESGNLLPAAEKGNLRSLDAK